MVKAIGDLVIVIEDAPKEKTSGGLWIPETAKERLCTGVVASVGEGKLKKDGSRVPLDVKPGDHVLFSRHTHLAQEFEGQMIICMHEADIIGLVDDAPGAVQSMEPAGYWEAD